MFFFLLFQQTFVLFDAQICYPLARGSFAISKQINFHQDFVSNKDHVYN